MSEILLAYLSVLVGTALLCAGFTSTATRLAGISRTPFLEDKRNALTPYLGSSIIFTFAIAVPATSMLRPLAGGRENLLPILVVITVLYFVELFGNSSGMLSSWCLGAEIAAAVTIWSTGLGIALVNSETVNLALNILWFVAIANAFKLINQQVGLAIGVTTITSLTLFALASTNGQILVATLSIGLAGSAAGFLTNSNSNSNSNSKLLPGESSARIIGFLIAFLSVQVDGPVGQTEGLANALTPVLVCSFVLFYLSLTTVSWLWPRRIQPEVGLDGINHLLLSIGLPSSAIRNWSIIIAILVGVLSFLIYKINPTIGLPLTGLVGLAYVVGGALLIRAFRHAVDQETNLSFPHSNQQ